MIAAGIALEFVMKLFSNGKTSQELHNHTNGCFKYFGTCRLL